MRGTPTNDYDFDTPRRDHPRVCGEHVPAIAPTAPPTGSSPRMRGTRSVGRAVRGGLGIIPAYAGNTSSAWLCMIRIRDHPRVCGEHITSSISMRIGRGSSPRMRGTLLGQFPCGHEVGIIPAYAGNTWSVGGFGGLSRDHPRVCGEHCFDCVCESCDEGSSPRMRGTPCKASATAYCRGIIPAYAGNTNSPMTPYETHGDHPRVCGEHAWVLRFGLWLLGSSPRMRGTPHAIGSAGPLGGIIPAYAGNTRRGSTPAV